MAFMHVQFGRQSIYLSINTKIHDLIIHEVLSEGQGKATQHNRKTKQHNTTRPKKLFFLAASGGT